MTAVANIQAASSLGSDLEVSVLGTLLSEPAAAIHLGDLHERLFTDEACRVLFQHIADVIRRYGRADFKVVLGLMRPAEPLATDLQAFMARAMAEAMPAATMPGMVAALRTAWQARELSTTLAQASTDLAAGARPEEIARTLIAEADRVQAATRRKHQVATSAHVAAMELVDSLSQGNAEPPLSTGLPDLNRQIGGFRRGNLIIIAGRPGMMKTTVLGATCLNAARSGAGVLLFSMEMPRDQLAARLLTDIAYSSTNTISYEAVLNRAGLSEYQIGMMRRASDELRSLPLIVDPQPGLGVAEIVARVRARTETLARKGVRLGLIGIDHLGKVRPPERARETNRNIELGEITNALADLAKDANACVVLLCQLNRAVEARSDNNRRPQLGDLRESGRIEEDADSVIGLYREAYYLGKQHHDDAEREMERAEKFERVKHDLDAIVLKNRHGAEGTVKLWVDAPTAAVRSLARQEAIV